VRLALPWAAVFNGQQFSIEGSSFQWAAIFNGGQQFSMADSGTQGS